MNTNTPPPPPKHTSSSSPAIANTSPTPSHTPTPPNHTPTPHSDHFPSLPLPIQQQFDCLQLSTNMQIESLASSFSQRLDRVFSLYHTSLPPPPLSHASSSPHLRPPPASLSHHQCPPLFSTNQPNPTLPEFGSVRGPHLRLDLPKFDGQDPAGWIFGIEEYFEFYNTSHDDRLRLVGLCMEGQASEWFRWMRGNILFRSWDYILFQVRVRFDPDHFEDYVGALSKLHQTTTVLAYQAEFERLLNKVTGVSDSTLISVFISGLNPQLRRELNLRRPSTLTTAFALGRELSALQCDAFTSTSVPQCSSWSTQQPATSALPVSTVTRDPPLSNVAPQPTHSGNTIRRITAAEKNSQRHPESLLLVRPKVVTLTPLSITSSPAL